MQLSIVCLTTGKGANWWGNVSTLQTVYGDFDGSNDTCPVGVSRETVINSGQRGGAIGFSTLPNPRKGGDGACITRQKHLPDPYAKFVLVTAVDPNILGPIQMTIYIANCMSSVKRS
jgi:hypothetical protein